MSRLRTSTGCLTSPSGERERGGGGGRGSKESVSHCRTTQKRQGQPSTLRTEPNPGQQLLKLVKARVEEAITRDTGQGTTTVKPALRHTRTLLARETTQRGWLLLGPEHCPQNCAGALILGSQCSPGTRAPTCSPGTLQPGPRQCPEQCAALTVSAGQLEHTARAAESHAGRRGPHRAAPWRRCSPAAGRAAQLRVCRGRRRGSQPGAGRRRRRGGPHGRVLRWHARRTGACLRVGVTAGCFWLYADSVSRLRLLSLRPLWLDEVVCSMAPMVDRARVCGGPGAGPRAQRGGRKEGLDIRRHTMVSLRL